MLNQYLELAIWADLNLPKGEKARILCPYCRGGNSGERSLSISHFEDGGLAWICFRASCGVSGRRNEAGVEESTRIKLKKAPRPYTGPLEALQEVDYEQFFRRFGLPKESLTGVRWAPEDYRFAFDVISPELKDRGKILRSFNGLLPKTLTFKTEVDEPFLAWYWKHSFETGANVPYVIVEDQLSALKVALAGGHSVSLNGTHFNEDMALEIREGRDRRDDPIFLALDAGTMPQMLTYQRKYDTLLHGMKLWALGKDLKYESIESIREGLFGGKTDFRTSATSSVAA